VIWDALKAACEADQDTAKIIIESAGIIVAAKVRHPASAAFPAVG